MLLRRELQTTLQNGLLYALGTSRQNYQMGWNLSGVTRIGIISLKDGIQRIHTHTYVGLLVCMWYKLQ